MAATDPRYEDGKFLVKRANDTLQQLHVAPRVKHWSDIGADVFVTLFEGISGEPLRDVIRHPKTKEDAIHNVQVVIDTLSLDILHISLSHITGEDVVDGSKRAIGNLLEVVISLMEFLLEEIRSEAASEMDGEDLYDSEDNDPDLVTRELIDDILEKELRKCHVSGNGTATDSQHNDTYTKSTQYASKLYKSSANSTRELIALGQNSVGDETRTGYLPSTSAAVPATANSTTELIALGGTSHEGFSGVSADDTAALIALGDSRYDHYSPPRRGPRQDFVPLQKDTGFLSRDTTGGSIPHSTQSLRHEASTLDHRLNGTTEHSSMNGTGVAYLNGSRDIGVARSAATSHMATVSPTKSRSSFLESSIASSVSMPQPVLPDSSRSATEFDYLGVRPRQTSFQTSSVPAGGAVLGAMDSIRGSSTLPAYTHHHHLYHHFERAQRAGVILSESVSSASLSMDQSSSRDASGMSLSRPPHITEDHTGQNGLRSTVPARSGGIEDRQFSSTLPARSSGIEDRQFSSTLPARSGGIEDRQFISTAPAVARYPGGMGRKAYSYDNLQNLMQNTVALSRAAVRTSPLRHQTSPQARPALDDASSASLSESVRTRLKNISGELKALQRVPVDEAATTTAGPAAAPPSEKDPTVTSTDHPQGICSPGKKANKKVSFKMGRTSEESRNPAQVSPRRTQTSYGSKEPGRQTALSKKSQSKEILARKSLRRLYETVADVSPSRSRPRPSKPWQSNTLGGTARRTPGINSSQFRKKSRVPDVRAVSADRRDRPRTFPEYLDKYYGTIEKRDRLLDSEEDDDELASPHSDSPFEFSDGTSGRCEDYNGDADVSEDVDVDLEHLRHAVRLPRSVHFEDILDDSAPGRMKSIRRKLGAETKTARAKAEALAQLYEMELEDFQDDVNSQMKKARQKSKEKDKQFKKKVLVGPKTNRYKPVRKYQTSVLRPRSSSLCQGRKSSVPQGRKRSVSASPVGRRGGRSPVRVSDDDLLPWLLEEFPFLHLSTQTLHELWRKSSKQIEQLTLAEREVRRRKPKAQVQIEEAEHRQKILMDIMKKELAYNNRVKDLKERQTQQQNVRTQLHDRRMQSARARQYYDDYQVRMRSKMLKKRTKEELVFKRLFREGLDIQKERIRELRRYAREQRDTRAKKQENDLEAIENYYRDQFTLLTEAMTRERQDMEIKDKAQSKIVEQMKKELRQKMEHEIQNVQEQLYRDEDEEYFRQLDADRLRHQLQLARYQATI